MTSEYAHTRSVRAGIDQDPAYGAVTPPLYLSSNFSFEGFGEPRTYDYTRSGNPTRDLLAKALADLEQGAGAVITSTGMSAVLLVLQLLKAGDRVIAPHDCYGGTYRLLETLSKKGFLKVSFVELSDPHALEAALKDGAELLWIETPSNPLLRLTDIRSCCQKAKQHDCLVAVDNTFLTPLLQKPITLGADLVIHSTTKYLNGHSDVVGGAVIAANEALFEDIKWHANCLGITGSPFDSFLTLRGLRTLGARLRQHSENVNAVLELLKASPEVKTIYHPSLPEHPQHQLAKIQQEDFGLMLSFELHGDIERTRSFIENLQVFTLAESLGGVESLICHPATMTHAAMSEDARELAGISPTLLRLSVGIEHPSDLLADLKLALDSVKEPLESGHHNSESKPLEAAYHG